MIVQALHLQYVQTGNGGGWTRGKVGGWDQPLQIPYGHLWYTYWKHRENGKYEGTHDKVKNIEFNFCCRLFVFMSNGKGMRGEIKERIYNIVSKPQPSQFLKPLSETCVQTSQGKSTQNLENGRFLRSLMAITSRDRQRNTKIISALGETCIIHKK